jgi:hypothetical protein
LSAETSAKAEAIHISPSGKTDCFAELRFAPTRWLAMAKPTTHTGSAIEYFTWLSAKLDSIEAIPSSRVSLFFRNAS